MFKIYGKRKPQIYKLSGVNADILVEFYMIFLSINVILFTYSFS